MGSLPFYERYKKRHPVYHDKNGGSDDPISHQTPVVLNMYLKKLSKVAEAGDFGEDSWMDHLDPQITYSSNKARLMEIGGVEEAQSPFQTDREKAIQKYNHLQKKRREKVEQNNERNQKGKPEIPADGHNGIEQSALCSSEENEGGRVVTSDENKSGWEQDVEPAGQEKGEQQSPRYEPIDKVPGDEYGYASVRMTVETANLLERMKRTFDLRSRRAVIEKFAKDNPGFFEDDDGELPPEWYDALERSAEFDAPNSDNK